MRRYCAIFVISEAETDISVSVFCSGEKSLSLEKIRCGPARAATETEYDSFFYLFV